MSNNAQQISTHTLASPAWQRRLQALSVEEQAMLQQYDGRRWELCFRVLDSRRRGVDLRNKWVDGVEHFKKLVSHPAYFFDLLLDSDAAGAEALSDLATDVLNGRHDGERNTDPRLHSLLCSGAEIFKQCGYDKIDYEAVIKYFHDHPERNPRTVGSYRQAVKAATSARLTAGLSQAELAKTCGVTTRTVVNFESGKALSSITFTKILQNLNLLHIPTNMHSPQKRARKLLNKVYEPHTITQHLTL